MTKEEILNKYKINEATLKNWIKTGLDVDIKNLKIEDISKIDSFIKENSKLSSRANKKTSSKNSFPKELFDFFDKKEFEDIFNMVKDLNSIYSSEQITNFLISSRIDSILENEFKNEKYKEELKTIKSKLDNKITIEAPKYKNNYILGVLIQYLMGEAAQSNFGSYYTPKKIINDSLPLNLAGKTILDPCSGSGFILFEIFNKMKIESNDNPLKFIIGNDINEKAALASIIELIDLAKNEECFEKPQITVKDGLDLDLEEKVDIIVMNPPYGAKITNKELEKKYSTKESYSFFIHKSIDSYLKRDGIISCILPDSILNIKTHKKVRECILENGLSKIDFKGKCFNGVLSNIVILTIDKKIDSEKIKYIDGKKVHDVSKNLIYEDQNKVISKYKTEENKLKIDNYLCKEEYYFLKPEYFYLGIVTGNNNKKIKDVMTDDYNIAVIQGKNFDNDKEFFISLKDDFQQNPNLEVFERNKIIYKFISSKINSKVDSENKYTINSVNIYAPESATVTELKDISDQLNSEISDLILKYKFGDVVKILKEHLCSIPIKKKTL